MSDSEIDPPIVQAIRKRKRNLVPTAKAVRKRQRYGCPVVKAVRVRKKFIPKKITPPSTGQAIEYKEEGIECIIPKLKKGIRIKPINGRIDRLQIHLNLGHTIYSHIESAENFYFYLGSPPQDQKGSEEAGIFGRIFQKTAYNGAQRIPLKIRRRPEYYDSPSDKLGSPLIFGGKLSGYFRKIGEGYFCPVRTHYSAPFSLNPTRALNHRLDELSVPSFPLEKRLFQDPKREVATALDGNDNILNDSISQETYLRGERHYLSSIIEGLLFEAHKADRIADDTPEHGWVAQDKSAPYTCPTISLESLRVSQIETYWEFGTQDALGIVQKLEKLLLCYGKQARIVSGFKSTDELGVTNNSNSVLLRLAKGEAFRIYAKLSGRIRIEVIHTPSLQKNLPGNGSKPANLNQFLEQLGAFRKRAAARVNALLEFIDTWSEVPPDKLARSRRYYFKWRATLKNGDSSRELYRILKTHGRIVGGKALTKAHKKVLRKAKTKGLIEYRNGANYPLAC